MARSEHYFTPYCTTPVATVKKKKEESNFLKNPLLPLLLLPLLFTREVERVLLHSGGVVVTLARPIQLDTLALNQVW